MKKVIYLAGPISGRLESYKSDFERAADLLCCEGVVLNPAVLPLGLKSHQSYMNICLPMLREADEVVLLPGWRSSQGARLEVAEAIKLRMPIFELALAPGFKVEKVPMMVTANDNQPAKSSFVPFVSVEDAPR